MGQEPPRSHLTPLNSTGAGETGAPRGAPRLGPRIAGSPGGGSARVSALLLGPRAALLASAVTLIGPEPGPRPARRGLLPVCFPPRRPAPELPAGWVPEARAARAGPPNAAEMTSKEDSKAAPGEERRRSPLDHLPPPANSNKPLTPFSIEDILNKPSVRRSYSLCGAAHLLAAADKHAPGGLPLAGRALLSQTSPLCALEELASKTFKGLEVSVLQAAEGRRRHWVPPRPAPRDLFRVSHAYCPVSLPASPHTPVVRALQPKPLPLGVEMRGTGPKPCLLGTSG